MRGKLIPKIRCMFRTVFNFLQTLNIFGWSGMRVEKSEILANSVCHSYIRNESTGDGDDDDDDDDDAFQT